ncbi:MAG: ADP-ribosylglycohydrolase family protein [Verrucomicrobiota bacterium]
MPELKSRLYAAIWGQFLGDAAALGTHWIYDLEDMTARYPGGIEGFELPKPGHYHDAKQSGDQTHYGDAALLLLESMAACGGDFREQDFGMRVTSFFGSPVCKSYRDHATLETLEHLAAHPENFQNGANDDQPATVSRLAPVVVAYHDRTSAERLDAIRRLTLVTQNHPVAVACATAHAVLLDHLLSGASFPEAFELTRKSADVSCDGSDYFEFAHMLRELDVVTATGRFGQSCPLAQSFPSALHAAFCHHDDFTTAIMETIRAGGDNAGRAAMIGAWLGALHGMDGIPVEWLEKLRARDRIHRAIEQLFARMEMRHGQAP